MSSSKRHISCICVWSKFMSQNYICPIHTMPAMELDSGDREKELFVEVDPSGRYGRYSELLGSGAVKKVYRAFDQEEGIEVAWNQVKLRNFCHDQSMMERLYSEVKLLTSLKNKNIFTL